MTLSTMGIVCCFYHADAAVKATDEYKELVQDSVNKAKQLVAGYEEKCKAQNVCMNIRDKCSI